MGGIVRHVYYRYKFGDLGGLYGDAAYLYPPVSVVSGVKEEHKTQQHNADAHRAQHNGLAVEPSVIKKAVAKDYHKNAHYRHNGVLNGILIALVSAQNRGGIGAGKHHDNAYQYKRHGNKQQREAESSLNDIAAPFVAPV